MVGSSQYLQEKDIKIFFEAKGVIGLDIDRSLNKSRNKYSFVPLLRGFKEFYIDFSNLRNLIDKNVLILNVYFKTSRKLYISDQDDQVIYGSDSLNK